MHRYAAILLSVVSIASAAPAATSTAPVAYVYGSTSKGVSLYDVSSAGKLTLVAGSPFPISGSMIGSNGKYFISLGTDYLHSYLVASNGAIKQQESQINTQLYSGADCGTTAGAVLDHTGQFVYVQLFGAIGADGNYTCDAVQTFKIGSNGLLTFTGSTVYDNNRFAQRATALSILASGVFAFNTYAMGQACELQFNSFQRESSGALNALNVDEVGPSVSGPIGQPGGWGYWPNGPMAADNSNHLAAYVTPEQNAPCGEYGTPQIASFTVDSHGNLSSTNTWQNMPAPSTGVSVMNMSPSGKLLAVGGSGLLVYHFNGAAPIAAYSAKLTTAGIGWLHWDNANHLYALSSSKLYVFTVTPTSISQVAGSPYAMASSNGLFVVPK